jgi:hypothetical protein
LVSATGDWTRDAPENVAPWLSEVYELDGAGDRFASVQFDADHNYDRDSRQAMYEWFRRWLSGGGADLPERDLDLDSSRLAVFSEEHPPPVALDPGGLRHIWRELSTRSLRRLWPVEPSDLARFRRAMEPMLEPALGFCGAFQPRALDLGRLGTDAAVRRTLIQNAEGTTEIPALRYGAEEGGRQAVLMVHGEGIAGVLGSPWQDLVEALVAKGRQVLLIDPYGVGEHDGVDRDASAPRFSCYNRSDVSLAVEDVALSVAYLRSLPGVEIVDVVGLGRGGLWSLLAAPLTSLDRLVVDVNGFDSDRDASYLRMLPLPLVRRWGGLATCGALVAPRPMAIHGTAGVFETEGIAAAYAAAHATDRLTVETGPLAPRSLLAWLLDFDL